MAFVRWVAASLELSVAPSLPTGPQNETYVEKAPVISGGGFLNRKSQQYDG